ncbi:CP26A-like protein [Mya arenaria]|uniref:CP26A-like protein n=1 Tax=Mya arenaria TaxID=6604 RepID=A0ABY7FGZ9_MYAAR|nr:CP26A-like protein [Mya arenaria]
MDSVTSNSIFSEPSIFLVIPTVVSLSILCLLPLASWIRWAWQWYHVTIVSREEFPDLQLPPGTMGYPVVGETIAFLKKGSQFYKEKMEQYGHVYKTHLLGRPTIRAMGADNVKKILMGENTLVTSHWPTSVRLLLGSGSISQSSGHVHKVRRKHMMHAFSRCTLDDMTNVIQNCVTSCMHEWPAAGRMYAYPECKRLAFTAAARALLGIEPHHFEQSQMHETFCEFLKNLMTIPYNIPGFGFRKGIKAKTRLLNNIRDILPDLEKRPYTPVMRAYYDSTLGSGTETETEILEGVLDLLFAGHETVASTATNCLMFVGQRPDVMDKLREEIERTLPQGDGCCQTADLSYARVNDMKYLNYVIKEVLRVCPPAGAGFRKALKSFELGGYLVPKGWTIMYSIRETHHTSPVFEDAASFEPDRWAALTQTSDDDGHDLAKFHYLPFGYGARSCIGKMYAQLVLKVFLVELVRGYDWRLENPGAEMRDL